MPSGTFKYTIGYNTKPIDISSNDYIPIINTSDSFTNLVPSFVFSDSTHVDVSIDFSYVNINGGDGLSFYSSGNVKTTWYSDNTTSFTITQFGGIPLSKGGSQFALLRPQVLFNTSEVPTILPNTSLANCFFDNYFFNSPIGSWNIVNVTDMNTMFAATSSFNKNISGWNTINVVNMSAMFQEAINFNSPINSWNTSNVTDMTYMFSGAVIFNNPVGYWNTSKVLSMSNMFDTASSFNQDISGWNTSNVETMEGMFQDASGFNQDISGWNTSKVTNMDGMFLNASAFNNSGAPGTTNNHMNWDVTNVSSYPNEPTDFRTGSALTSQNSPFPISISGVFSYELISQYDNIASDISNNIPVIIDPSSNFTYLQTTVSQTQSSSPFRYIVDISFTYVDISQNSEGLSFVGLTVWYESNVQSLTITQFGGIPLSRAGSQFADLPDLELSFSATDSPTILTNTSLESCFQYNLSFNSQIGSWDTKYVTDMSDMFSQAYNFDQDISEWNTSAVTNMYSMFFNAQTFNQDISKWNTSAVINMYCMFSNTMYFNQDISGWNTSNVIEMRGMFSIAQAFNQNISIWNTSNVIDMNGMFSSAQAFNQDISGWNTSKVTNMDGMFLDAPVFNNGAEPETTNNHMNWDVTSVSSYPNEPTDFRTGSALTSQNSPFPISISGVFKYNLVTLTDDISESVIFANIPIISEPSGNFTSIIKSYAQFGNNWNVEISFTYVDVSQNFEGLSFDGLTNWYESNVVSLTITQFGGIPLSRGGSQFANLNSYILFTAIDSPTILTNTSLERGFYDTPSFNSPIGNWDTTYVTDMTSLFECSEDLDSSFNQDISGWNTSNVTNMARTFRFATNFNQELNNWNTSNVTDMERTFRFAKNFNQELNNWNTHNVKTMEYMFAGASNFNKAISAWNTHNVISMGHMFYQAYSFNQDISGWNTHNVKYMDVMFQSAHLFNKDINIWDTANLINMAGMFANTNTFNSPLSNWDTSGVKNMSFMFRNASAFNSPIASWDTRNVETMESMFQDASGFNLDINGWNTSKVTNMNNMFLNASAFNNSGAPGTTNNHMNWDVTSVSSYPNEPTDFRTGSALTSQNSPFPISISGVFSYELISQYDNIAADISNNIPVIIDPSSNFTYLQTTVNGPNQPNPDILSFQYIVDISFAYVDVSQNTEGLSFNSIGDTLTAWYNANINKIEISQFGGIPLSRAGSQFANLNSYILFSAIDSPTILTNTSLERGFYDTPSFNSPIGNWDTTYVTDTTSLFECNYDLDSSFNQDISGWNTSNVTNMNNMFLNASRFNQDLSGWNTSNVITMQSMFQSAINFNKNISNWDTSKVQTMYFMFSAADSFNQDLSGWNTSKVTNMGYMFSGAGSFNKPIDSWNTKTVTEFGSFFSHATNFNQELNNWNTSGVINMSGMFQGAINFNKDIGSWDTSTVKNMRVMFDGASNFNQPLSNWNTSGVTNMSGMFKNASAFNSPIASWDTRNVETMEYMFQDASGFNLDISGWNTSKVTNMDSMFLNASAFNNSGAPSTIINHMNWDVSNVSTIPGNPPEPSGFRGGTSALTKQNSPFYTPTPPKPVICFKEDSKILCLLDGKETYLPIQTIRKGTLVKTRLNGYVPVNMIGTSKIYNPAHNLRGKDRLYRCSKESYPELTEDLIITGCHSILVDTITDEERAKSIEITGRIFVTDKKYRLIACVDERAEPYEEEGVFNIWHLALDNDDIKMNYGVYANGGLLVETTSIRMLRQYSGMTLL
jgi:surface protein